MSFVYKVMLLISCTTVLAFSQIHPKACNSASAINVGRDGEVTILKMRLSGKWGSNEAVAYLPDKEIADGAVLFWHSEIRADDGTSVDLLPFALTLAKAGAAVIVPKRTLIWPPKNESTNREGSAAICAAYWLVDHTNIFNNGQPTVNEKNYIVRESYAYVGPRLCDPAVATECEFTGPFSEGTSGYCPPSSSVSVPIGETEGADCTRKILADGGLWCAKWIQQRLRPAPIRALVSNPHRLTGPVGRLELATSR